MEYILTAPCLFGLEGLLGDEIDELGYRRIETIDGRVTFAVPSLADIARANINLRFAERVLLTLGSAPAPTFDTLFEAARALPWEDFIGVNDAFVVNGHSVKSDLFSLPDCQRIIKKATVERLRSAYGVQMLPETAQKFKLEFFIIKNIASFMLDTTGAALHKRGYRPQSAPAPLRETLAAALVKFARPRENVLLCDPFCGTGTIAIEAALMMTGTAPGLHRSFASESWSTIPATAYPDAFAEAKAAVHDTGFEAVASDIDGSAVASARDCVARSGMSRYIRVEQRDALTITTEGRRGTIVCNPPYGERMSTVEESEELYRAMGRHFAELDSWQIYVLTSHTDFPRLYGRRPDKVRRLYNGMIKCNYYQFFKKL